MFHVLIAKNAKGGKGRRRESVRCGRSPRRVGRTADSPNFLRRFAASMPHAGCFLGPRPQALFLGRFAAKFVCRFAAIIVRCLAAMTAGELYTYSLAGACNFARLAVVVGLFENAGVGLGRYVVGGAGGGFFGFAGLADLAVPADFDRVFAPLGAALAGADGLAIDLDEDRVGVQGGEDADGDPA